MQTRSTNGAVCPSGNLSKLCSEAIDEILRRSREEEIQGNENLIHQIRVLTKRLRAAWNLVKGIVPVEKVKERRTALREISAQFSGYRDQAVLKNLCDSLAEGKSTDQEQALQSVGGTILLPGARQLISSQDLAKQLEEEKREWLSLDWSSRAECDRIVGKRLKKSYRKARKTTRKARKMVCSETWHNWRKAIKQLRYQREFLAELEGRPLTDFEINVRDLGSLLGQRNDLANLEKYVASKFADSVEDQDSLESAIDESTIKIMKKCRRMGKKLFRKKSTPEQHR